MPHGDLHKKKLKKNLMMLALIFGIVALIWAVTMVKMVNAAEIDGAGDSTTYDMSTESNVNAVDIYTRQIAYRDEAIKLREQIFARSRDFAEPRSRLQAQYKQQLQELHESITADNIPSFSPHRDEE